ncbi:MAG: hypothetical protein V3V78_01830 [Candidatus Woesearchaeota archaeon]
MAKNKLNLAIFDPKKHKIEPKKIKTPSSELETMCYGCDRVLKLDEILIYSRKTYCPDCYPGEDHPEDVDIARHTYNDTNEEFNQ